MILIINTCKQDMHYYEFVKPIEDVVKKQGIVFHTVKIENIRKKQIEESDKIIITGTSLHDFDYERYDASWIIDYAKPILGICAGMQIICKAFGCEIGAGKEIGLKDVKFKKSFLAIKKDEIIEAYCLHNSIIKDSKKLRASFDICATNDYVQAIKHKHIYATLFHPEVRNKKIIEDFLGL